MLLDDLQQAIAESPDSPEPYLVFADWLQSHGDPFGEFIALSYAQQNETSTDRFVERKIRLEAIRKRNARKWADMVELEEAQWRWGFIRSAMLEAGSFRTLAASRAGRFIREAAIRGTAARLQIDLTVLPPTLIGLRLVQSVTRDEAQVQVPELPQRFERLSLEDGRWVLPKIKTRIRDLRLLPSFEIDEAWPFVEAHATQLETLHLSEAPWAIEHVVRGQAGRFPHLTELRLEHDLADDALRALAKSPLLGKLERLVVAGPFTDAGIDEVLKAFARFSRLREIVIAGGSASKQLRSMAKKQLPQMLLLKNAPASQW